MSFLIGCSVVRTCCCDKMLDEDINSHSYYCNNNYNEGETAVELAAFPPETEARFFASGNRRNPPSNKCCSSRSIPRQIYFGFKIAVVATLSLYLLVPFLYHVSPSIQRHLVFLPFVRWPHGVNFSDPESEGLAGCQNFYLSPEPSSSIGIWHLLPVSEVSNSVGQPDTFWSESLKTSGKNVILYMHGNSGSRAGEHRKELYTLLQHQDFHVVCFDYRGYADSTQSPPSETTAVADGTLVYKWIRGIVGANESSISKVFVWGHSLGTGVSSHVVANLCLEGDPPDGLVLESPFTSIAEEVKYHMLSALWRYMPGFDYIFSSPLKKNDIAFESDKHISVIHIPIFILHAVDDPVVPYFLGKKLYKAGLKTRSSTAKPIYFRRFGEGHAHKFICRSPELAGLICEFVRCINEDQWPCKLLEELTLESFIETEPID